MKYLMTFSYDGSKYSGYQKQPKSRTIQGEIEKVLKTINDDKIVDISASGRTDAGVHALNQKAHFELEISITPEKLQSALNSMLPKDIYVKKVETINNDFHARFSASGKEYIYKINMGEYDPILKDYMYQYCRKLDIVSIERALKYLEGTHNFKSFTKVDEEKDDYVRTIIQGNLVRDVKNVNYLTISFLGTGFMRYMIRNMVGLLIEIGEGKKRSEDVLAIIDAKDRKKAGICAPPEGLYLKDVFYR